MKKLFALLLIAGCGLSFVGCGGSETPVTPAKDKPAETKPEVKPDAPPAPEGTPAPDAPAPMPAPEPAPAK